MCDLTEPSWAEEEEDADDSMEYDVRDSGGDEWHVSSTLTEDQRAQLTYLLEEFADAISNTPGAQRQSSTPFPPLIRDQSAL